MKIIVAVVRSDSAAAVGEGLSRAGHVATKLASTGGFLKAGNSTFLIGVENSAVDEVITVIRSACGSGAPRAGAAEPRPAAPAAATIFVLDVDDMVKV